MKASPRTLTLWDIMPDFWIQVGGTACARIEMDKAMLCSDPSKAGLCMPVRASERLERLDTMFLDS